MHKDALQGEKRVTVANELDEAEVVLSRSYLDVSQLLYPFQPEENLRRRLLTQILFIVLLLLRLLFDRQVDNTNSYSRSRIP